MGDPVCYRGGIVEVMAMTLRLTEAETEQLRTAAAREGVSMQEFARTAIGDRATGRRQRIVGIVQRTVDRDRRLLDRLAQ